MNAMSCPKCGDPVRLPESASRLATVRCPLCLAEYPLAEILATLPPALLVIADPEVPAEIADPPGTAQATAEYMLEPERDSAEAGTPSLQPSFNIQSRSVSAAPKAAGSKPARRAVGSPGPKKKNPVSELLKVVIGGVAGLAIAQAILWWMPWASYRRDPFDLGPQLARVAPWAVPAEFHGVAAPVAEAAAGLPPARQFPGERPARPKSQPPADGSTWGLPKRSSSPPGATENRRAAKVESSGPSAGAGNARAEPGADPGFDAAGPVADPFGPPRDPEPPRPWSQATDGAGGLTGPSPNVALDMSLFEDPPFDASGDASPAVAPDREVDGTPRTSAAELVLAMEDARGQVARWTSIEDDQLRDQFLPTYRALARLGEVLAWLDPETGSERAKATSLLRSLGEDASRRALLARGALVWLQQPDRESDGLLVIGTVKRTGVMGGNLLVEVQLEGTGETVAVFSKTEDAGLASLQAGDEAIVLGAVLPNDHPASAGYAGSAGERIWNGLAVQRAQ